MSLAALSVSVLLVVGFILRYMLDVSELRRLTLEAEADDIAMAVRAGHDPSAWPQYRDYPMAYAFRAVDKRLPAGHRTIAAANADLLPALPPGTAGDGREPMGSLDESFGPITASDPGQQHDRWMLTTREQVDGGSYWIQVAMVGDPAWRWRRIISIELLAHVLVPVGIIVPALTIAMLIATRHALRPLSRIALHARALGRSVASGTSLTPLPQRGLPREFTEVVAALNAMLARLETSLMQQRQFASDAAHELRTPLAVLRLQIAELPPGPVVQRLDEELADLAKLVNQLLRFAQAEEAMSAERRSFDIRSVVRKVCEDLAPAAVARNQVLELDGPEQVLVSGHPDLLDVAIRNIIDNAIKMSPPHTTISIAVDRRGSVVVDDSGPGVPDAQKDRIFDRFWRADRRRADSSGIGLALVRRIAQLHGGDVRVQNRPQGGARFLMTLGEPSIAPNSAVTEALV
jgi:signal transduction histidine kinase